MVAEISPEAMARMPQYMDCYLPQALHVMIRFGMWQDILKEPGYPGPFPIAQATRHYARGVALANLDRFEEARTELASLRTSAAAIPEDALIVGTPARPVFEVAKAMLEGEILFQSGETEAAFVALRRGVALEDALPYDEPPGWMQPVRHALGALLLQEGQIEEAEVAYREDLTRHPNNGWALHGLAECLERRGEEAAAAEAKREFTAAWKHADVEMVASCYCRRK
jgi:tetratricopeptide (TPR) repeat protein